MTLLIDIRMPNWMEDATLRDRLQAHLAQAKILLGPQTEVRRDVRMLATVQMHPGMAEKLPNLELVQKLGAGVETMLANPHLPRNVRVARLAPKVQAVEIAEYCLAAMLSHLRGFQRYHHQQSRAEWLDFAPRRLGETCALVLGLGHIGGEVARLLLQNGVTTLGWSRGLKQLPGITTFAGEDGLAKALGLADFIIAILPSTGQTRGLLNHARLAMTRPGSVVINAGRGDLIEDQALLDHLDQGHLDGAILDVFHKEPLPVDHPFWRHEKIQVTPHVSGFSIDDAIPDIAENYRRLVAGKPLLGEIDRNKGY